MCQILQLEGTESFKSLSQTVLLLLTKISGGGEFRPPVSRGLTLQGRVQYAVQRETQCVPPPTPLTNIWHLCKKHEWCQM